MAGKYLTRVEIGFVKKVVNGKLVGKFCSGVVAVLFKFYLVMPPINQLFTNQDKIELRLSFTSVQGIGALLSILFCLVNS